MLRREVYIWNSGPQKLPVQQWRDTHICNTGRVKENMHLAQGVGRKDTNVRAVTSHKAGEDSDWTRRLGIERAGDEPPRRAGAGR